jgi:hypothetical protein
MATSPIYSWPEPDNTDLVKNGALAIRTLGNAIDTTMGTMVAKTVVDAKGDLIAGTAADTVNRLAVGANGESLVADSSTSTGLRYTAGTVQSNPVLNSAFQIAQRGTSISVAANTRAYTLDRWDALTNPSQACTISRQATGDTTNLPNIQYAARFQRNSGQTGTGVVYFANSFETINSLPFAGKTVTFSFYARAGANYSSSGNALSASVATGTGTDQAILTGYTGTATPITVNATLTTTWQRFTGTAALSSSLNEMCLYFNYAPTGTAGANDYFEVTGVQIDIGSVALPFRTYAGTIQGELAACQRYYYRSTGYSGSRYCTGFNETTTNFIAYLRSAVTMRVTPTAVDYSNLQTYDGAFRTVTNVALVGSVQDVFCVNCTVSGVTANQSGVLSGSNASSFIGFSAEL